LSKDEGGGALFMMGKPDSGGLLWHNGRFFDFCVARHSNRSKKGWLG